MDSNRWALQCVTEWTAEGPPRHRGGKLGALSGEWVL